MEENRIEIDRDLCNGCGLCVTVCPTGTISLIEGKAAVSGGESISCGHCEAVCPRKAIRVTAIDEEMSRYKTFTPEEQWLPARKIQYIRFGTAYGLAPVLPLLHRPARRPGYARRPHEDRYHCTVRDQQSVLDFHHSSIEQGGDISAAHIASYFAALNATAEKAMLRFFLKLIGKGELDAYYHGYYQKVKEALEEWHGSRKDRLFHGSTAAMLIGSKPGASCPAEDALLATQNILLAAHSMGLGSCLIGYAVAAMKKDPSIQQSIGIPSEEEIHAVIALGYPDEVYQRIAGRKKVTPRYFEG